MAVQGSPCIAVIHHPLCITGPCDVQTPFTTAEAVERRPFSGPRPFVFDTEVPRKRHFLWKFTSVLLLAKTRVNELLRVQALGNGRGETLNVFQLLPSFLPSVSFIFLLQLFSCFYPSCSSIIVFLVLLHIRHMAVKWIAHYREVLCSYLSPETGFPSHWVFVAPFTTLSQVT
jgi:hypothetical protein